MSTVLFVLSLLFYLIPCLSGLNLTYYPAILQATNATNVSSFDECACKCLSSSNCRYFGYWSSLSSPTCQIYTSSEDKPQIISYVLPNNDSQSGLYGVPSTNTECQSSISSSSYNYTNVAHSNVSLGGDRIISVLVMPIGSYNRLLAIDYANSSYYIFDINTFQIVDNGTFSSTGCLRLCAQQFSNLLYIGCTLNFIEVRQFFSVVNTNREEPLLLYSYSTSEGGPPQSLAILNSEIIYYVINTGEVYALFTQSNTSKQLYSFSGLLFASPSVVLALDSINMGLFLVSYNGTLFRLQLSSTNVSNVTSIDQYELPLNVPASLLIDNCNRLWVLSSPCSKPQMLLFIQQENSNYSFSMMTIINFTNSLPTFTNAPYNFEFDANYSLFTANVEEGVAAFFQS